MFDKKNHSYEQQKSAFPRPVVRGGRRCRVAFAALVLTLVVFSLFSPNGAAQANLSTITGTVTDSTGAVIPNCTVTITSTATTAVRKVTTDGNGFYSVPALSIGDYNIAAAMPGFNLNFNRGADPERRNGEFYADAGRHNRKRNGQRRFRNGGTRN